MLRRRSWISLLILLVLACKDNEYPQPFPIVITENVINVTSAGAEFVGRVESFGKDQTVLSYGFVWSYTESPTLASSRASFTEPSTGEFRKVVTNDLLAEQEYIVRAFIETDNLVVYGNAVQFASKGSLGPEVTAFTPTQGNSGSQVVVEGRNFSNHAGGNIVKLGTMICEVTEATEATLNIKIPNTSFVGDLKLTVTVGGKSHETANYFRVLGPRISSFSRSEARIGDLVIINGEYFTPETQVYFGSPIPGTDDINRAIITSVSPSQLECFVPWVTGGPIELHTTYSTGFKKYVHPEMLPTIFTWARVSQQTPLGNAHGYSAVTINGLAYVVGGNSLYSFNATTGSWLKKADFPGGSRYGGSAFVMKNDLYYGFGESGLTEYNDIWRYDPTLNEWELAVISPISARSKPLIFVIGSNVYIGFGYSATTGTRVGINDFWLFDPSTGDWSALTVPPVSNSDGMMTSFTAGTKGYIFGGVTGLWEFDPVGNKWTRKKDGGMPFYNGNPAVSRGETGIVFSGSPHGFEHQVYEYHPSLDLWVRRQTMQGFGRVDEIAFVINGDVYYGLGKRPDASTFTPDLWVLDLE